MPKYRPVQATVKERERKFSRNLNRKIKQLKEKSRAEAGLKKKEYQHIYSRAKQLTPQIIDFIETIFAKRAKGELHEQLVFLGRGSRAFYYSARQLAKHTEGVSQRDIKLVDMGRRLSANITRSGKQRKLILDYLRSQGVDLKKPITFIDTGVIGTVPNDLIQCFKLEKSKTEVNGFMFYGRNVTGPVGVYAPSKKVKWGLRLSPREARALIETFPKSVLTIKALKRTGRGKVKAEYKQQPLSEQIGAWVAAQGVLNKTYEYIKRKPKSKP